MDTQATAKILCAFVDVPDPRRSNRRHKLIDILTVALFAVVCGADGWVEVVAYAKAKLSWLKTFLELPGGVPSHDTFGRVFRRLSPDAFERCFRAWMASVVELSGGKLVAIDGKSLRHSFEHAWDKSGMAHIVSAFVQANHMVFAQVKTEGKGQELSAMEKLLDTLDLSGAVVTIDALGCNGEIAAKIRQAGGDYVLQVKQNQPSLLEKLQVTFKSCLLDNFKGQCSDSCEQTEAGHGRIETRRLWACWDVELLGDLARNWPGLKSMLMVERTRTANGKTSVERHYYIASLDARRSAKRLAEYVRGHWSVENNLHWQLDVSFNEDRRRIRKDHGAENYSRLCRISLNLLGKEKTNKVGIAIKRHTCGWDNDYLLKVIAG
jgi:predicted transposase YbfD/YdcC